MKKRNRLSDEELRRAAREALQYETELFLMHDLKPEHQFSEQFIEKMTQLLQDMKQGKVKAAEYFMGWQYYAKQGIAAVLICFLLACAAMPEAVLAGYHKLIEVVETIYEEYTEFRYKLNEETGGEEDEFKPIKLKYLPEGLIEVERIEDINSLDILYKSEKGENFNIYQKLTSESNHIIYNIDTENAKIEVIKINGENVELVLKKKRINFIWIHDNYRIIGQSNLSRGEVIKILESIEFE